MGRGHDNANSQQPLLLATLLRWGSWIARFNLDTLLGIREKIEKNLSENLALEKPIYDAHEKLLASIFTFAEENELNVSGTCEIGFDGIRVVSLIAVDIPEGHEVLWDVFADRQTSVAIISAPEQNLMMILAVTNSQKKARGLCGEVSRSVISDGEDEIIVNLWETYKEVG